MPSDIFHKILHPCRSVFDGLPYRNMLSILEFSADLWVSEPAPRWGGISTHTHTELNVILYHPSPCVRHRSNLIDEYPSRWICRHVESLKLTSRAPCRRARLICILIKSRKLRDDDWPVL